MSALTELKQHKFTVEWSTKDDCYIARTDKLRFVAAHGLTPVGALVRLVEEVKDIIEDHNKELDK